MGQTHSVLPFGRSLAALVPDGQPQEVERHILVHEIDGSNTLRYVETAG